MNEALLGQVTVVCVTYKSARLADRMAITLGRFPNVVLVDNDSRDGGPAVLHRLIPQARIIERLGNGGFGRACNEGVAAARTPFVLLLNPDCHINADSLAELVQTLYRYPSAGIVAPQSWRDDGTPQLSYRPAFFDPQTRAEYRIPDATCCAKWLHGCCLLVRVDAFRAIGGFDEQFFLYYEDDDLCLRMLQSGFECLLEPAANAYHSGGASSGTSLQVTFLKRFHYARSRHLAIRKHQGAFAAHAYLIKTLLGAILAVPVYAMLFRPKYVIRWLAWGYSALMSLWMSLSSR